MSTKYVLGLVKDFIRKLIPAILLLVYSSLCALLMNHVEKDTECAMADFWTALSYMGTIHTTIGYGNVNVCSVTGRALAMGMALIGIPLALVSMDNIGLLIARVSSRILSVIKKVSRFIKHKTTKKSTKINIIKVRPVDDPSPNKQQLSERRGSNAAVGKFQIQTNQTSTAGGEQGSAADGIPLLIPVLLVILWILLMAAFFVWTEQWTFFNSVYFSFITVTTIGFGDITPEKNELTIVHYTIFFIGLTLFSMCINMIQELIESFTFKINRHVKNQYYERIKGEPAPEETAEESASKANTRRMIRKQPGARWIPVMTGSITEEELVEEMERKSMSRAALTQTVIRTVDCETMTETTMVSVGIQTNPVHMQHVKWETPVPHPAELKAPSPEAPRWRF